MAGWWFVEEMGVQLAREAAWEEFSAAAQMITNSSFLIKSPRTDHARKNKCIPGSWPNDGAKTIRKTKPTYAQQFVRTNIVIAAGSLLFHTHVDKSFNFTIITYNSIVHITVIV